MITISGIIISISSTISIHITTIIISLNELTTEIIMILIKLMFIEKKMGQTSWLQYLETITII